MLTLFYLPASGAVYNQGQLFQNTGFSPDTDPDVLAANGIYTVVTATNDYDANLYSATASYSVSGSYAYQAWTYTPRPLPDAKWSGSFEVKNTANAAVDTTVCDCGFTTDLLVGVAGQDVMDRPARFQAELDEMVAISNQLDGDLTAIDNATTVDEINNIVNPPMGIIHIGRGDIDPLDLDPSYYVSFNSVSLTEADTELYIPGTSTVVTYGAYVPGEFDSPPGAFALGDYLIQIREVSTSRVIAEFECPLNPAGEDVAF